MPPSFSSSPSLMHRFVILLFSINSPDTFADITLISNYICHRSCVQYLLKSSQYKQSIYQLKGGYVRPIKIIRRINFYMYAVGKYKAPHPTWVKVIICYHIVNKFNMSAFYYLISW